MFHIVDFCWDYEDSLLWSKLEKDAVSESRHDPCDDDVEFTAPFVGILPEESGKENGSPLRFQSAASIDREIQEAFRVGIGWELPSDPIH